VVDRVEEAKAVVRSEAFYDADRYLPAMRTLYHGLRLASAAHHPCELTPHNFTTGHANDHSTEVLAATRDREQNPFLEHFEEDLLPRLLARRPRVLGMSVIYGSQLVPALTLGRLVKQHLPDCHVTAGGGFLAYIGRKLMSAASTAECLDSLVFHEGEGPLLALCESLRDGTRLHGVGSLAWFDGGAPVFNDPAHPVRLDAAPPPDFDGLPFERYFSPEPVLPYDVNRGCYYGECTFCTLPTVIGPGFRTRSAATIADHVVHLRDRYGARNFNLITDCMPPGMLRDLPEELIAREAGVNWWADARVEPRAYSAEACRRLYESGCRKLLFGFESASPRILKLMQKGQSPRATLEVARNCADAGISVTFYAMVGFPGETREEARQTLRFLVENNDVVREVSLQTFHVDEVAVTYREPERFGMTILDDPQGDLALYHDYEAAEGMTRAEAAEAFQEMMAAFREAFPLFEGDHLLYFMQKSHYFLHLARGTTPEEFAASCDAREAARGQRGASGDLLSAPGLALADLPFSYVEVVRRLGHPLARAIRPDFTTGRYVAGAREAAESALGSVPRDARVLAYAPGAAELAELRPDGRAVLEALTAAGSLLALADDPVATDRLRAFAEPLARLGILVPADSPTPIPS
jgi:hypothetical protein